jgi:hypothetical protein
VHWIEHIRSHVLSSLPLSTEKAFHHVCCCYYCPTTVTGEGAFRFDSQSIRLMIIARFSVSASQGALHNMGTLLSDRLLLQHWYGRQRLSCT